MGWNKYYIPPWNWSHHILQLSSQNSLQLENVQKCFSRLDRRTKNFRELFTKILGTICDLSLKCQSAVTNFNKKIQIYRTWKILNKNFRSTKVSLSWKRTRCYFVNMHWCLKTMVTNFQLFPPFRKISIAEHRIYVNPRMQ